MKKYKLIKEYPGSPKLNTNITSTYIGNLGLHTFTICGKDPNCDMGKFRINDPENYKEFWEEIIEKEYEVLSIKNINDIKNPIFAYLNDDGYMHWDSKPSGKYYADFMLNSSKNNFIHSIKRLSDGEIFTIGDKIVWDWINNSGNEYLILEGFTIKKDELFIIHNGGAKRVLWEIIKNRIAKYIPKKPLFTTEDGVDIFEGDKYYYITTKYQISANNANKYTDKISPFKRFSTKEAAEEYIINNKPCLSLKDVSDYLYSYGIGATLKLKKLVKSKL